MASTLENAASLETLREPGPLHSLVDDWWNPILVKEVRQALRGKFFRVSFVCTLAAVTVASFGVILGAGDRYELVGRDFLLAVFACFAIAILGLVPFAAFTSMGAEWDENTHDLLVISNLKPRQIIGGKLLSALSQMALYFATFTPYLVFSFLLQGVDLRTVLVLITSGIALSITASVVALMLSTLSRVRVARVALLALLASMLVPLVSGMIAATGVWIRNPSFVQEPEFPVSFAAFMIAQALVGAFCFGTASNMLSHAEENRSTGMRVLTTITLLVAMGFLAYFLHLFPDRDALSGVSIVLLCTALIPGIFFVTEPERLGRRVSPRVPRLLPVSLLATPYMPGGGRGVILYLFHAGLVVLFLLFGQVMTRTSGDAFLGDGVGTFFMALLYGSMYLLLPSGLLSKYTDSMPLRIAARVVIPGLVLLLLFIPSLMGFFIGDERLMEMEHAGNPFLAMEERWDLATVVYPHYWMLVGVLLVLAMLFNMRRILRGVFEVLEARRRRLERDRGVEEAAARDMTDALVDA